MHYFKIAVVSVAALVCSSTAARVHMFENDIVKNSFEVNKYGRGALVAQPKARAATAEKETVTVTVTTIPDYCNAATPMIPLFPTTSAKNSSITTVIKTLATIATGTGVETTPSATEAATTTPTESTATTSVAETSSSSEVATKTSSANPTGTTAGPAQSTSAAPTSNDAEAKHFNGALVAALIALTGNVIFLI